MNLRLLYLIQTVLEVLLKSVQGYISQASYDQYFCRGVLAQSDYIVVSVP